MSKTSQVFTCISEETAAIDPSRPCAPQLLDPTNNVRTALPAHIDVTERGMILASMNGLSFIYRLLADLATLFWLFLRPRRRLAAENLFLRKQLTLYQARGVKPRRPDAATRISLVLLSRCFDWRNALVNVTPQTLVRCHRQGFRLFWRWKSKTGRPAIPTELRVLIRRIAAANPSWGQERSANERLVKLGIPVSPRTVSKHLLKRPTGGPWKELKKQICLGSDGFVEQMQPRIRNDQPLQETPK